VPSRAGRQEGCGWPEATPCTGVVRPRALRDPHQAAGKDTRGEKHTGGRRWPHDASQRPGRLPQRRLLGRVRDIIRLVPCGQGACGVTFPGSRCKSFGWPVFCWACVPALPRLTSQALHKRPHPPWSIESRWRAMRACNDSSEGQPQVTTAMPGSWTFQARWKRQGRKGLSMQCFTMKAHMFWTSMGVWMHTNFVEGPLSAEATLAQLQVAIAIQ